MARRSVEKVEAEFENWAGRLKAAALPNQPLFRSVVDSENLYFDILTHVLDEAYISLKGKSPQKDPASFMYEGTNRYGGVC